MNQNIKDLLGKWDAKSEDRPMACKRYQISEGNWIGEIPRMPAESEEHYKDCILPFAPDLLGMALKKLNYLYDRAPFRKLKDEKEEESAKLHLWDFGMGLDSAMAEA